MNTDQTNDWSETTSTYWEDRHESILEAEQIMIDLIRV